MGRIRQLPGIQRLPSLVTLFAFALAGTPCADARDVNDKIDTEDLFGFLTGTDIGEPGEKEFESETTGLLGKRSGTYTAFSQRLAIEYTPVENLRLEVGAIIGYHDISGVPELDALRRLSLQGLSLELRYRLLDRNKAGIGITLLAEPHWSAVDETSGQRVTEYGAEFALLIDKELIANRVVGVFNLLYEPEISRSYETGTWSRAATYGIGAGAMIQLQPGFLVGGEARYLRAYEALVPDHFAGHALFIGPNVSYRPAETWKITASWSVQVAGRAVTEPGFLDLANFTRHQVRLRIRREF